MAKAVQKITLSASRDIPFNKLVLNLASIIYQSFAGLGLLAGGNTISAAQLLQPGRLAQVGIDAGKLILDSISGLMGFVSFFDNFIQIVILLIAWLIVVISFFIMAIQLFVSLIEFKLTARHARAYGSPAPSWTRSSIAVFAGTL